MKHFRKMTKGKTILMGETTYKSIGKALPGRKNIVVSFDESLELEDAVVYNDLIAVLEEYSKKEEELFVIGGKSIYEQSYDYADRLYITYIDREYEGNVFLEKPDFREFDVVAGRQNCPLTFALYERIKS